MPLRLLCCFCYTLLGLPWGNQCCIRVWELDKRILMALGGQLKANNPWQMENGWRYLWHVLNGESLTSEGDTPSEESKVTKRSYFTKGSSVLEGLKEQSSTWRCPLVEGTVWSKCTLKTENPMKEGPWRCPWRTCLDCRLHKHTGHLVTVLPSVVRCIVFYLNYSDSL